jgi:hypothetical protein
MTDTDDTLPPDAAARDAAKRADITTNDAVADEDFHFVTRNVTTTEKAAVIAVLSDVRAEETASVKRVARVERQPWRRAQRLPRSIGDLLDT